MPRSGFQARLRPSVRRLSASGVRGVAGVLDMFGADVLTFREFMMGEPLPLATLHNAVLERIFPEDFGERRIISESYLNPCSICSHYKFSL